MTTRNLGGTELQFTPIGIGTWAVGGGDWSFGWGHQDEREGIAGIRKGLEHGVNWIDTAPLYGDGVSEALVGKALQGIPLADQPMVATKCGRLMREDGSVFGCLTRESILAECEASLQRLGVDCIDLYQIHWPDPDSGIEEAWSAMAELKKAGKVREIGVSNHSVAQLKRLQAIHPVASLQPPYSMINREIEDEAFSFCREENIGVLCYSPMGKGLLTGGFTKERAVSLSENDHRSRDPKFQSPQLQINLALVDALRPIAEAHGRPLVQLCLAWVLRRSEVTGTIVGVRNPQQIDQTAGAADWVLNAEELDTIARALKERDERVAELGDITQGRV